MRVGVPKEIKNNESRVGLTPTSVQEYINHGHSVLVEKNAGADIGFSDSDYEIAGAAIAATAAEIFEKSELIIKIKEPQAVERQMLNHQHTLFTYLHLAPDIEQTKELIASGATCIAYETVTDNHGRLPLLTPMSQVAGRMSIQVGAHYLEKNNGGAGVLLGGVPGVEQGKVTIIGSGVVGENAAQMALGLGADVTIIGRNTYTLARLAAKYGTALKTIYSTSSTIAEHVANSNLVIGSVLVKGALTPKLVTAEMIKEMMPGSVVVDVAVDQGGCFATSRPTTHSDPTYIVDDVIHYCVANMPGAVPRTSTNALNNATLPFGLAIADHGYRTALKNNAFLREGLNICRGQVTYSAVAKAIGCEFVDPLSALES